MSKYIRIDRIKIGSYTEKTLLLTSGRKYEKTKE